MKKIFVTIVAAVAVFLFGNTNVFAGYWSDYFNELQNLDWQNVAHDFIPWEETDKEWNSTYIIQWGANNPASYGFFPALPQTENQVYYNVKNVTAKSSNENVITVTTKEYDFSKEKAYFENWVKWYNDLTLEELKQYITNDFKNMDMLEYYQEELKGKYGEDILVTKKPEWWNFDYDEDPQTWWKAYGFESEPESGVEVIYKGHDLGKAKVTLSAEGKGTITFNWTLKAIDLGSDYKEGLIELLNNQEHYKDVFPKAGEAYNWDDCNFSYVIEENDDLSDIINALKGKDITINFIKYNNGIESFYKLNGKDIKNEVDKGFTYDHKISMENSVNKDKIDELLDADNKIYLDFTYHGSLPAPFNVQISIYDYIREQFVNKYCGQYHKPSKEYTSCYEGENGKKALEEYAKYIENATFTLLYYNPDTGKMEVIEQDLKPNEDGILNITFDHFSSYVIVKTGDYKIKEKDDEPETSDLFPVALVGMIALGLTGTYTYRKLHN